MSLPVRPCPESPVVSINPSQSPHPSISITDKPPELLSQESFVELIREPLQGPSPVLPRALPQEILREPTQELPRHHLSQELSPATPQAQPVLAPINASEIDSSNITAMGAPPDFTSCVPPPASNLCPGTSTSLATNKSRTSVTKKISIISKQSKVSALSSPSKKRPSKGDFNNEIDVTPPKKTVKRTPAKPKNLKPATPPTITRPSRARKAPERLVHLEEVTKAKPVARKPISRVFEPEYATTNSQSRLGKADVYHMLLDSTAWTSLTITQQATLIKMMAPTAANKALIEAAESGSEVARPKEFQVNFDMFRTDVAKFQEDLRNGHLAKTWLAGADQAVKDRAAGAFDSWKSEEAELWWGQKSVLG